MQAIKKSQGNIQYFVKIGGNLEGRLLFFSIAWTIVVIEGIARMKLLSSSWCRYFNWLVINSSINADTASSNSLIHLMHREYHSISGTK